MLYAKAAHEIASKNNDPQKKTTAIALIERLITRAAGKGVYAVTLKADFPTDTIENVNKYVRPLLLEKGYRVSEKDDKKITIRW